MLVFVGMGVNELVGVKMYVFLGIRVCVIVETNVVVFVNIDVNESTDDSKLSCFSRDLIVATGLLVGVSAFAAAIL